MNNYDTEQFTEDLDSFGVHLTDQQLEQFLIYYEMLAERNQVMNLTAVIEYGDVMKKHFLDSISLVKAFSQFTNIRLIDVGSGAGFPGLALKIAFPELHVTLLDSLKKRVSFLCDVIDRLGLQNIEAVHGRAEDFARSEEMRGRYDLCVSRAVANLSTLSEYCLPFVKKGGLFISYKSEKLTEELEAAGKAIFILGGELINQVDFFLPGSDIYRSLVVIRKERETSLKYPRKAGLPSRQPL